MATSSLGFYEYVFLIMTGTTSATTIEGFTISSATPNSTSWGGFKCQTGTSPTIKNNILQVAAGDSAGICVNGASSVIKNNVISGFTGGIEFFNSASAEIENCIIHNNCYGMYLHSAASVDVMNCTVVNNLGAGIKIYPNGHVTSLKNSIVYANNTGPYYVFPSGVSNFSSGVPDLVTYSNIGGGQLYPGVGNINAYPLFVEPSNDNYHLLPLSPCIDAGDHDQAYNDPEDPNTPNVALYPALGTTYNDMGAYGGPGVIVTPLLPSPPPPLPTTRIVPAQYSTIQEAINAANPGDTILVESGDYPINTQIYVNKDLIIKSELGPESTTLFVGESVYNTDYVFLIMTGTMAGITSATTIEGFTIKPALTNATSYHCFGCQVGTRPTIQNNVIQGGGTGYGFYICTGAALLINNNVISNFGYGIYLNQNSSAEITNCIIHSSTPKGIRVTTLCSAEIRNCTVTGSTWMGIDLNSGGTATVKNSIVYANNINIYAAPGLASVTYSDIGVASGFYTGTGNINADPLFVNPTSNDYHLQSIAGGYGVNSPCIDSGNPDPIYNDPDGTRNDMGAYGGPGIIIE